VKEARVGGPGGALEKIAFLKELIAAQQEIFRTTGDPEVAAKAARNIQQFSERAIQIGSDFFGNQASQLAELQGRFRGETDPEERARLAQEIQRLSDDVLAKGADVFGQGSAQFTALQDTIIAALTEIGASAEFAKTESERLQDKIDAVNATLADQLEYWKAEAMPLFQQMDNELRAQLAEMVPPGTDMEALINSQTASTVFATALVRDKLEEIRELLADAESGNFPTRRNRRNRRDSEVAPDPDIEVGRAAGGPVEPFRLYPIGEHGPELLAMGGRGGTVISQDAIARALVGSRRSEGPSVVINLTANVTAPEGGDRESARLWAKTFASQAEESLALAVESKLLPQLRAASSFDRQ
jgi:LPS O-antigen subunit length determinant protein (WzzB/FepE family)